MKRHLTALAALVLALGTTAGCGAADYTTTGLPQGSDGAAGAEGHSEDALAGTAWLLETSSDTAVDFSTFVVTANFTDGVLSGKAPVNNYTAEYEVGADGAIEIGAVAATRMAGEADAMAAETVYFDLLGKVSAFQATESTLELRDGAEPVLVFSANTSAEDAERDAAAAAEAQAQAEQRETEEFAKTLVGQPLDEAEAAATAEGYQVRVISEDGKTGPATTDFRTDRINVTVVDGEVTEVNVG